MSDPDAIGPDGTVRLRCYLRHENIFWFSAGCPDCGHVAPIGVRPAIEIMGGPEATVGQLERRLRCSRCGGRRVGITIAGATHEAFFMNRQVPEATYQKLLVEYQCVFRSRWLPPPLRTPRPPELKHNPGSRLIYQSDLMRQP
jgi:hypothetical protein